MSDTSTRYSIISILFHWSVAALVIFLAVQGVLIDDMPRESKAWWINLHSAVGIATTVLLLARIIWRIGHKPPPLPEGTAPWVDRSSHIAHLLLYALMVFVSLAGLINIFARGRGVDFGAFAIPQLMPSTRSIIRPADEAHALSSYVLMAIAAIHILAAAWHQFWLKDHLMLRMMPQAKSPLEPEAESH